MDKNNCGKPQFSGEWVRLGELISKAKVARCGSADYPVLSMTMHDGIVEQSGRFKKAIASTDKSTYKVVNPGQLVVGFPIDEGVLYVQNCGYSGIMSPAYNVWNIDADKVLPSYLELALHSPQSMNYYVSKIRGTTARRRSMPAETLCELPISLPGHERQRNIVATLAHLKSQQDNAERQLALLDTLVKSRFIEMFGDPNSKQCEAFIEDAFFIRDDLRKPLSGKERDAMKTGELYPYYGANGKVDDINQFLTDCDALCFAEDCGSYGPGEPTAYVIRGKAWVNNHAHLLVAKCSHFLEYARTYFTLLDINRFISGTTRAKMTQAQLKKVNIEVPDQAMLREFDGFVSNVDKLRFDVQQQIDKLELLKNSLMQEYFG